MKSKLLPWVIIAFVYLVPFRYAFFEPNGNFVLQLIASTIASFAIVGLLFIGAKSSHGDASHS